MCPSATSAFYKQKYVISRSWNHQLWAKKKKKNWVSFCHSTNYYFRSRSTEAALLEWEYKLPWEWEWEHRTPPKFEWTSLFNASLRMIIACFVLKCSSKPKPKEIGSIPINWIRKNRVLTSHQRAAWAFHQVSI